MMNSTRKTMLIGVLTGLLAASAAQAANPPAPATTTAPALELSQYAGEYFPDDPNMPADLPPMRIVLENGALIAKVEGAPDAKLKLQSGQRFALEGMPEGFAIEFRVEGGQVVGGKLFQGDPEMPLPLKRSSK